MGLRNPSFLPGQCWVSESEPELGVGFVRDSDSTTVTLVFPLVGESRRYGRKTAPLKRLEFREGDTVQTAEGGNVKIERIEERDGLFWYHGGGKELLESLLSPKLRLQRPLQRFLAGHWDPLTSYLLRQRTQILASRHLSSPVRGMIGAKARLIPHQLYVADQISARALPRALLADEVGLGKTIEAGLILHRLATTGRARRVLILTPPALVNQWFVELLRRFNLSFWVPSSQSEDLMTAEDYADQERLILGVDSLLDPIATEGLLSAAWDLVIVDEAHRVDVESEEFRVLRLLADKAPGLLLLTATPEQLGLEGHFARLQLIDPSRFPSWEAFQKEYGRYRESMAEAEKAFKKQGRAAALELIDRMGTGRVYYRNSRKTVEQEHCAFPKRTLVEHPLKSKQGFGKWLGEFASELRSRPKEKILVICESPSRATALEKQLREEFALKAVAFHEDMPLLARDRSAAYFEDPDGATILVSSEIGGEGRNFQHARHLVLTDLPADPDVLEQRIGRLDRIGGPDEIQIHVAFAEGDRDEKILRWHRAVFDSFAAPPQGGSQVYQKYAAELAPGTAKAPPASLIKKARADYLAIQKEIEQGRDRLIELHSFDAESATQLVKSITDAEKPQTLRDYLDAVFDSLGLLVDDLDNDSMFVEAGDSAFASYVPALPPEGMRFTFSREKSVARNDLTLMTWDHPLVTGMMEAVTSQELGNASVAAWTSELGKNPFVVESHFVFETHCDPKWNLAEYFAPAPVRILLDGPGADLTAQWTLPKLQEEIGPLPGHLEAMARRIPPDGLRKLLGKARDIAEKTGNGVRDAALKQVSTKIAAEIQRLEQLRARNGMVSERELAGWHERKRVLTEALQGARVRLDSILVVLPPGLGGGR